MADYNLGTARGEVVIGSDTSGLKDAQRDIAGVESSADKAAKRGMDKLGTASLAAGIAVGAGLGVAIKSAADFEQRMSAVEAVSGASGSEMEQLRNKALQLGKDTAFSASESASAIEELVKAGVSVPDVMNGAADATVALAAAGEIALPQAAELAANAMNAFNLSAKDMPRVADLIAGAANASAIDVGQFGQSLQQVGAVANLAGVSLDDTATAIALLGNAGIKGSDAGTSLKSMFQRLNPQTEEAKDLMKELGIITADGSNRFYDAQGNMKGLGDVSEVLGKSLEGMTKQQQQAALTTLFGADAIRAAAILSDEGAAGFDKMAKSMGKVSAADVAAKRMDNLAGAMEEFMGSIETLLIQVGTPLLNGLRGIVEGVTGVINKFLELDASTQKMIGYIALAASAGLIFVGAALKIGSAISGVIGTIRAAGGAMAFLNAVMAANPIGLIIIAIGALVAAFILAYKHSETFRNIVDQVVNVVGSLLKGAFQAILPIITAVVTYFQQLAQIFMTNVWPVIKQVATAILNQLRPALAGIISNVQSLIPHIVNFGKILAGIAGIVIAALAPIVKFIVANVLPIFVRLVGFFAGVFISTVVNIFNGVVQAIRGALKIVTGIAEAFVALFKGDWQGLWNAVKKIASGVWDFIKGAFKVFINIGIFKVLGVGLKAIRALWKGAWNGIKSVGSSILKAIANFIKSIFNGIRSTISGVVNGIRNFISSGFRFIQNIIRSVMFATRAIIQGVWNTIRSVISGAVNGVRSIVSRGFNAVRSTVSSIFNSVRSRISSIWNGIRSSVSNAISGLMSRVRSIRSSITGFFSGAGSWLVGAGRNLLEGLARGVREAGARAVQAARDIVGKVRNLLPFSPAKDGPLKSHPPDEAGEEIINQLARGIQRAAPEIDRIMSRVAGSAAAPSITGFGGTVAPVGGSLTPAAGGMTIGQVRVEIPAADIAEMQSVTEFFERFEQEVRRATPNAEMRVA